VSRPESPIGPGGGATAEFAAELRRLRELAGLTYRELGKRANCSASALCAAAGGRRMPTWEITGAFVKGCGGDKQEWRVRWEAAVGHQVGPDATAPSERDKRSVPSPARGQDPPPAVEVPPPGSLTSPQELIMALRATRARAGNPSLRKLSILAEKHGHILRPSTLGGALTRTDRLPSLDLVEAFLAACDVPAAEVEVWRSAWTKIAYLLQQGPATGSVRWHDTCPYRGLAPFDVDHMDVFYGRELATARLVRHLAECRNGPSLLVVTGPSGAGKSSLLQAGLLPALAKGALGPGSSDWPRLIITPGRMPIDELAVHLGRLTDTSSTDVRRSLVEDPGSAHLLVQQAVLPDVQHLASEPRASRARLVLVVDQFEEVFTLAEENERATFIASVAAMAGIDRKSREPPPAIVVLGIRVDFLSDCLGYPALTTALRTHLWPLGPLAESELRLAIIGPAAAAGLTVEPGLVDTVLADMGSGRRVGGLGAGALSLLSQAMLLTWEHREGTTLTLRAYASSGGLDNSIRASAEAAYRDLTAAQQAAARKMLLRMVTVGSDDRLTCRRAQRHDLETSDDAKTALEIFTAKRLIVLTGGATDSTAAIAHEALLHAWPRLQSWLEDERARIRLDGHLFDAAISWQEAGGDQAFLYRDSQLDRTLETVRESSDLPPLSCEFLAASVRFRRHARRVKRLLKLLAALVPLLVLALGLSVTTTIRRHVADSRRSASLSRQVGYESQTAGDDTLSGLLAVAAWKIAPTDEARRSLSTAFTRLGVTFLTMRTGSITAVAFSPDGRTLATGGSDGTAVLWDMGDRAHPIPWTTLRVHTGPVVAVAFSPNGRTLATGSSDRTVRLWNVNDLAHPTLLATLTGHTGSVGAVGFSFDGRTLATGSSDRTVRLWNVNDLAHPTLLATLAGYHTGPVDTVAFSPDGVLATASSANTVLWEVADLSSPMASLVGHTGGVGAVAFSHDGRILATRSGDRSIELRDLMDLRDLRGRPLLHPRTILTGHTGSVNGVAFSRDDLLASAGSDNTVRLWGLTDDGHSIGQPLIGVGDRFTGVAFSPDGHTLAASEDGPTVQLWALPDQTSPEQLQRSICQGAGRNLSTEEWTRYIPGIPYRDVCSP